MAHPGGEPKPDEPDAADDGLEQLVSNPNPLDLVQNWLKNPDENTAKLMKNAGPIVRPEEALKAMGLDRALNPEEQRAVVRHVDRLQNEFNKKLAKASDKERAVLMQQQAAMIRAVGAGVVAPAGGGVAEQLPADQLLMRAIRGGDVRLAEDACRRLLSVPEGPMDLTRLPPLRFPGDPHAHPLLHWAVLENKFHAVEWCLTRSKAVNVPCDASAENPLGETALHWATLRGHWRVASKLLLEDPMLIQAADHKGYQCAHYAAQNDRMRFLCVVKILDVDQLDVRDASARTPLHWACYKGNVQAAKFLLDNGANAFALDKEQCLPLHWACIKGHREVIEMLINTHRNESTLTEAFRARDVTSATATELLKQKLDKLESELKQLQEEAKELDSTGGEGEDDYERGKKTMESQMRARQRLAKRTACDKYASCLRYMQFMHERARIHAAVERHFPFVADLWVRAQNYAFPHWSWAMWPLLAPIGWLVFYYKMLPVVSHHVSLVVLFSVCFWLKWVFWILLQNTDPGNLIKINKKKGALGYSRIAPSDANEDDDREVRVSKTPKPKYAELRTLFNKTIAEGLHTPVCLSCQMVKLPRSKHDRVTDVCVDKFDHFCPWMNSAVGRNNYAYFVSTSFCATIAMWTWIVLVVLYTREVDDTNSFWSNFKSDLKFQSFAWFFLLTALYGSIMSGQHIMLMLRNLSTNEMINRGRYRYLTDSKTGAYSNQVSQGWLLNVAEVYGLAEPIELDVKRLYSRALEGEEDDWNPYGFSVGGGGGHSHGGGGGGGHSHGGGGGGGHSHGGGGGGGHSHGGGKQCDGHH